jgi:hemerythrin-like domain-containing protein
MALAIAAVSRGVCDGIGAAHGRRRRFYRADPRRPGLICLNGDARALEDARADAPKPEPDMQPLALRVITDEHQALSAMLTSLSLLVAKSRRDGKLPPFDVLRAMLFYIDEFPERLHHPKETTLLFPRVRVRVPELAGVLDRLDRDHAQGEHAIRGLEHAMLAFEVMGEPRRAAFEQALERYQRFYLDHMSIEEREVLPAARTQLSADDWKELDAAFAANRDPLTGHEAAEEFKPLFRKIVMTAPAPIGLG